MKTLSEIFVWEINRANLYYDSKLTEIVKLDEAGIERVFKHAKSDTPFIVVSAMRGGDLSHNENLRRHVRLGREIKKNGLGCVVVEGNDFLRIDPEIDPESEIKELSYFIPLRKSSFIKTAEDLKEFGKRMCKFFLSLAFTGDTVKRPWSPRDTSSSIHKTKAQLSGREPIPKVTIGKKEKDEKLRRTLNNDQWGFIFSDGSSIVLMDKEGSVVTKFNNIKRGKSDKTPYYTKRGRSETDSDVMSFEPEQHNENKFRTLKAIVPRAGYFRLFFS